MDRAHGFTWKQVADMLLASRWTIRRRVVEYGLQETTGFSGYLMNRLTFMSNSLLKSMGILWDVLWRKAFLSLLASDFNAAG